jgi:hypothetical protein
MLQGGVRLSGLCQGRAAMCWCGLDLLWVWYEKSLQPLYYVMHLQNDGTSGAIPVKNDTIRECYSRSRAAGVCTLSKRLSDQWSIFAADHFVAELSADHHGAD